jgi:hypothetical protein
MLRTPTGVHLHPVPFLPGSRGHPWRQIRHAHRYVELGMHPGRTPYRLPTSTRRGRGRSVVLHHRASGNATTEAVGPKQASQKLHQLERYVATSGLYLQLQSILIYGFRGGGKNLLFSPKKYNKNTIFSQKSLESYYFWPARGARPSCPPGPLGTPMVKF